MYDGDFRDAADFSFIVNFWKLLVAQLLIWRRNKNSTHIKFIQIVKTSSFVKTKIICMVIDNFKHQTALCYYNNAYFYNHAEPVKVFDWLNLIISLVVWGFKSMRLLCKSVRCNFQSTTLSIYNFLHVLTFVCVCDIYLSNDHWTRLDLCINKFYGNLELTRIINCNLQTLLAKYKYFEYSDIEFSRNAIIMHQN